MTLTTDLNGKPCEGAGLSIFFDGPTIAVSLRSPAFVQRVKVEAGSLVGCLDALEAVLCTGNVPWAPMDKKEFRRLAESRKKG